MVLPAGCRFAKSKAKQKGVKDMETIRIENGVCVAPRAMRDKMFLALPKLEGRRKFVANGEFRFEDTGFNRRVVQEIAGNAVFQPREAASSSFGSYHSQTIDFRPPVANFQHQDVFQDRFGSADKIALFAEMGTGKTKMAIDRVNKAFCDGQITGVLVLAKKGVHAQWVVGEENESGGFDPSPIERFTQSDIPFDVHAWSGKKVPARMFKRDGRLKWFTMNFDAPVHKKAREQAEAFVAAHNGTLAFVGDETHYLKTHNAKRTQVAIDLAKRARLKIIMTGTPIAKNLLDEWSQFQVLDPLILGHKYKTTFQREFCVMGGFEGKQVVGAQNLERFKAITEPFCYRVLKRDCLDLPEKQYETIAFDLSPEQKAAIAEIKTTGCFTRADGVLVEYETAVTALQKIQEISNGFFVDNSDVDNPYVQAFPNPRLDALKSFVEDNSGKFVVWCRYQNDIRLLQKEFGAQAVTYYGETSDKERVAAKKAFMDPSSSVRFFIASVAAAGEGVDGLQTVCDTAIYYSNSYNSLQRWQSEDRIHRIGMGGKALYIDLVARGGIDRAILRNLKRKADFAHTVLDLKKNVFEGVEFKAGVGELKVERHTDEQAIEPENSGTEIVNKDEKGFWNQW